MYRWGVFVHIFSDSCTCFSYLTSLAFDFSITLYISFYFMIFFKFFFPILQIGGPYLALYLWGFIFVLSIFMMTVYPILIAPLFNKFTPVSKCFSSLWIAIEINIADLYLKWFLVMPWLYIFVMLQTLDSFQMVHLGIKLRSLHPLLSFPWKSFLLLMVPQDRAIAMWVKKPIIFLLVFNFLKNNLVKIYIFCQKIKVT